MNQYGRDHWGVSCEPAVISMAVAPLASIILHASTQSAMPHPSSPPLVETLSAPITGEYRKSGDVLSLASRTISIRYFGPAFSGRRHRHLCLIKTPGKKLASRDTRWPVNHDTVKTGFHNPSGGRPYSATSSSGQPCDNPGCKGIVE